MSLDERERIDDHTRKHAIYLMTTFTRGSQFLEQLLKIIAMRKSELVSAFRQSGLYHCYNSKVRPSTNLNFGVHALLSP
ncbi:hypothetical protein J6590_025841 [Homalodisca vitripennis]|nr:hypothetical protein J6590_025841 [Homalodisca vitripennis]